MTTFVALVAGLVAGTVLLVMLRPTLAHPALQRTNYRDHALPTAGGLVTVAAVLAVEGVWAIVDGTGVHHLYVLVVLAFGALGFIDDVLGTANDGRGFVAEWPEIFGRNAGAVVVDVNVDARVVGAGADDDAASLPVTFDGLPGIVEEVDEDLLQLMRVRHDIR